MHCPGASTMTKITTPEMECALANWFGYRQNLIVPNVHWGMNMHECDLLVVSKAGYCTEVEIKVTRADLRRDAKKAHGHQSNRIMYLYFAIPSYLEAATEFVPERAGIILVSPATAHAHVTCRILRAPICRKHTLRMSDRDRYKVARLGALRIWDLKQKLL